MSFLQAKANQLVDFIKSIPQTFYSIPFYKRLVKDGNGIGLRYLFVVALLIFGQSFIVLSNTYGTFWTEKEAIFQALPEVTVDHGKLSIKGQDPLALTFLEGQKEGPLRIIFDTAQDSSNQERISKKMDDEKIFVLVTKDKIFLYDQSVARVEVSDVASMKDTTITHEDWVRAGRLFSYSIMPSVLVSAFVVVWFSQLFWAFAGGVLILVFAPLFKVKLVFKGAMRLASAARIPGAAFLLVLPPHPLQSVMLILFWLGFIAFGLLAVRKEVKESA